MRLIACALFAAALLLPRPAAACSDDENPWSVDPEMREIDHQPPGPVRVRSAKVQRAVQPVIGDRLDGCGIGGGDGARLLLQIDPAEDDLTNSWGMGYRLEKVAGKLPRELDLGPEGMESWRRLAFSFSDPEDDEIIDFTVRLIPLDLAGNEGPPSDPIHIRDEGLGCNGAGGGSLPLALAVAASLLMRRRRQTLENFD